MTKLLCFSDIHIHPWTAFATVNEKGLNNRLVELTRIIKRLSKIAEEENCSAVIFGGDLFHTPKVGVEVYDLVSRALQGMELPFLMIPGNHDEASRMADYHSMRAFCYQNIYLFDDKEYKDLKCDGLKIGGIPFFKDNEEVQARLKKLRGMDLVLMHSGFVGATAGFDYIADQKNYLSVPQLKLIKREIGFVVAGHFHQPQYFLPEGSRSQEQVPLFVSREGSYKMGFGGVLIPGAPIQHTFGDAGSNRGYWILDFKKRLMEFRILKTPQFVKFHSENLHESFDEKTLISLVDGNYVNATVTDQEEARDYRGLLEEYSRGYLIHVEEKKLKKASNRLQISFEDNRKTILARYLKSKELPKERRKKYLRTGLRYLQLADEEL
jgi:DNA repair exonuclease SbcCD nuclease subunit